MSHTHVHERAFGGPVIVDVGPDVGALVVYLGSDWLDDELHLRSVDRPAWSTHTGVWERHLACSRHVVAAVFPSLPRGDYEILDRAATRRVTVEEARVTEIDLR
jgi:hypothetical protein